MIVLLRYFASYETQITGAPEASAAPNSIYATQRTTSCLQLVTRILNAFLALEAAPPGGGQTLAGAGRTRYTMDVFQESALLLPPGDALRWATEIHTAQASCAGFFLSLGSLHAPITGPLQLSFGVLDLGCEQRFLQLLQSVAAPHRLLLLMLGLRSRNLQLQIRDF